MKKSYKAIFIVLIILALLISACSSDDNKKSLKNSDKTPVKTVGGTVTLEPLFYSEGPDGPSGGTSEMTIELRETKVKNITVAISDDEVQGSGDQWEASAWNAMTVSTLITGASLDKRQFQVNATGFIDGPSAGALMTVGAISLIRGDKIDSDVTMTGTINPDGTVGPVGGIQYKLEGAKKAGKTTVLIPSGQLREPDENGDIIDLKEIGDDLDLDVIEVANVYEAYDEFTGKSLPKLEEKTKIELDSKQKNLIEDVVSNYSDEVELLLESFKEPTIAATLTANGFDDTIKNALDTQLDAESYLDDENYSAALASIRDSYGYALTVENGYKAVNALATSNDSALNFVDDIDKQLIGSFTDFNDVLSSFDVNNLSDAESLVDAYSIMTVIIALEYSGLDTVNAAFDESGALAVAQSDFNFALGKGIARLSAAIAGLEIQQSLFEDKVEQDSPIIEDKIDVPTVAKFFRQGADSNLEAFKTIIVQEVKDAASVDENGAFDILYNVDPSIEIVFLAQEVERNAEEIFGNNDNIGFAQLGASVELFTRSSELMAKYYSLGLPDVVDGRVQVVDFRSLKAYKKTVELAKDQLDGVYSVISDQGFNAYTMVNENDIASIEDESDPTGAIRGLRHYWKGYVLGRVYSYLGGFPTKGLN